MQGSTINGRYEILELLGEGGMARVYRARDRHLGREVAVKVLLEAVASDPDLMERFRREARAAAALTHPNIVQVYDFLDTPEGSYLILELVRGEDLRQRLRREGALAPQEAQRIAAGVLAALEHAHGQGLVHRDLSARNVLLDAAGGVRVSDFGIARALGDRTLTRTGELLGSVQYLSPEQARGEEAGPRSDLYSVGVLLYEMLTGTLPFTADSPVQVALKHINEAPPPPSSRRAGLPPGLERLVLKAMAKSPEERFASAAEMARAVAQGGALEPTLVKAAPPARPPVRPQPPPPPPPEGPAPRRGALPALAAVALLVLVGAFLWTVSQAGGQVKVPDFTRLTLQEAQRQAEAAGLDLRVRAQEPSPDAAPNTILSQEPAAATMVAKGARVFVVVSRGPETVAVPDLSGLTLSRAREELDRLGLVPRIVEEEAPSVPVGVVARQDPAAGTQVTRGTPVQVVVSAGSGKEAVPDLVGMKRQDAEKVLADLGMTLEVGGTRPDATAAEDTVLEQRPSPGTMAGKGQKVQVVLSQGGEGLEAPDVVGKSLREAREVASGLGLELVLEGDGAPDDAVTWQSPEAGEPVSGRTLTVRAGRSAVVPGLAGLTVEQAAAELEGAGLRLGEVRRMSVAGASPGEVLSQDPKQGMEVPEGTAVDVFVADPSAPTPVGTPDVPPAASPSPNPSWVP